MSDPKVPPMAEMVDDPDPYLTGRQELDEILSKLRRDCADLERRIAVMEEQVRRGKQIGNPIFTKPPE